MEATTAEGEILYGVAAIAKFLGIPKRAAQHQIDVKRLPVVRLGRTVCARLEALRQWARSWNIPQAPSKGGRGLNPSKPSRLATATTPTRNVCARGLKNLEIKRLPPRSLGDARFCWGFEVV